MTDEPTLLDKVRDIIESNAIDRLTDDTPIVAATNAILALVREEQVRVLERIRLESASWFPHLPSSNFSEDAQPLTNLGCLYNHAVQRINARIDAEIKEISDAA